MSYGEKVPTQPLEKKIRFKSTSKVHYSNDHKTEEWYRRVESKNSKENMKQKNAEKDPSLFSFLQIELTRGYLLEHDEERFSARREKVYSFMKIPQELEKFMAYGFFQCADSLLFVYTFLPLRFLMAFWSMISRLFKKCFGILNYPRKGILKPAETCDVLKGLILITCSILMCYIDTNMMYHLVKSQSVMKLYIFYNMLEVGDRLFSAFGQDTLDALFWTATEPRDRRREHLGVIPHFIFALVYVFLHSLLVLFQATTLNVAFNSNNKSLLIIMMSNNFVELKGSVFKKFDKNNLFQVSCSDVRERLHLSVLLFIVVLQTMKEYLWREERFWVLVPDCILVLGFEVVIDWLKHAFITRFNEIPSGVYREYTVSLAYDLAQSRQRHAFSDHSDLVARRMGFIPLPLGVILTRVLLHSIRIDSLAPIILIVLAYICLISIRVLVSIVILGKACDLIVQHQLERTEGTPKKEAKEGVNVNKDCEIPSRANNCCNEPDSTESHKLVFAATDVAGCQVMSDGLSECCVPVGAAAIFSNSAVDLQLRLNPRMDDVPIKHEPAHLADHEEDLTRSEPDIKAAAVVEDLLCSFKEERAPTPDAHEARIYRRSESEPNLAQLESNDK